MSASTAFIPIAHLHADARTSETAVCMGADGIQTWADFTGLISALTSRFTVDSSAYAILGCKDPLNFLAALLALWQCGRTPIVPANFQPATLQQLSALHDGASLIDDDAVSTQTAATAALQFYPLNADSCRIALYTSGSSGEPKRIDKTLTQLDTEVATLEQLWGHSMRGCAVLASVPHHHIYGLLFRLLWPLAAGRPFDRCTCANPEQLRERIAASPDHVLVSSPSHLTRFPDLMEIGEWQPAARLLFSSGGPLPAATADWYRATFGRAPLEIFGSTETGGVAWRCRDGSSAEDDWTPLPGITIERAADGALLLGSPFLPVKPWRMDDAIALRDHGRFSLQGRLDRVIKLEGKRLSLPEMEQRLETHPWVAQAVVTGLPGAARLGAVVVPSVAGHNHLDTHGRRMTKQLLREHLKMRFEPVLLPRRFRFVDALPVSDRGKLTQHALQSLFEHPDETDA